MRKLIKLITLFLLSFLFINCVNTDKDLYDPNYELIKYNTVFVNKYGEPDKSHDWGFIVNKTRGYNESNKNMWAEKYFVPDSLTTSQINLVTSWFSSNKNPEGVNIDFSNFFYQQVSSSENAKYMNNFYVGNDELQNMNCGEQEISLIHYGYDNNILNDINNRKLYRKDKIGLLIDGNTSSFGYRNSNDGNVIYNDYVVIDGEKIDTSLKGRYFVGLDFHKEWNDISELDGYYNDWIVCITKCYTKGDYRIIAEDLSVDENGDFDFNDVVFDIKFIDNTTAKITVLAAGGTLPLYIDNKEVHELFGVSTNEMINTGYKSKDYTEFILNIDHKWDPNNIPVYVNKNKNLIELKSNIGMAPSKICVKNYYVWCNETESIELRYPKFTDYVINKNTIWY